MNINSGKACRRSTSKHIDPEKDHQSVTPEEIYCITPPSEVQGRLQPWLELANLLPPPPSRPELAQTVNPLVSMLKGDAWPASFRAVHPSELLRRFEGSKAAQEASIAGSLDLPLLRKSEEEALRFHHLVTAVASALHALVAAASPHALKAVGDSPLLITRLYQNPETSRSEIWMRHGVVTAHWIDPFREFLRVLDDTDITRVRQCPICNHFFLSFRKDQKACSKRCNTVRRVRDWRKNQEQHEYKRKLRGAGLLNRTRRKRRSKPSAQHSLRST